MSNSAPLSPTGSSILEAPPKGVPSPLLIKLADDPWTLNYAERFELRKGLGAVQVRWLTRIGGLIEPPEVDDSFPAFLLGTRPFAALAQSIGEARSRRELDTGCADELQRFVDHYRSYMVESAD